MTVPPPEYGLQLPQFPAQEDNCSSGLYVILYMFMVSQKFDEVYFPKEGTHVLRMWLAKKLCSGEFAMSSMEKNFRAKRSTESWSYAMCEKVCLFCDITKLVWKWINLYAKNMSCIDTIHALMYGTVYYFAETGAWTQWFKIKGDFVSLKIACMYTVSRICVLSCT